jgi:hypothetical protein
MSSSDHPRGRTEVEAHVLSHASCLLIDRVTGRGQAITALDALVWDCCDGALSQDHIANQAPLLAPQVPTMRDSVYRLLEAFADHGLLMNADDTTT